MQTATAKGYKGIGMEGFIARWYGNATRKDAADFRRTAQRVAAMLPGAADVLEVAPGPGYFAIELARLGDHRIVGLDISRSFVDLATKNAMDAGVRVDFRNGNASEMPLESNSFDFIFCRAAFKNFSEPVKALDEMHRVLRPGGKALIIDLNKETRPEEIDRYIRSSNRGLLNSLLIGWTFKHMLLKRAYTTADFERMARQSAFNGCTVTTESLGLEVLLVKNPASSCDSDIPA